MWGSFSLKRKAEKLPILGRPTDKSECLKRLRMNFISLLVKGISEPSGTEFYHVTGDTLQMFKVRGQRSRSSIK